MDSLLVLGPKDERLERLLGKLGYDVVIGSESTPLSPLLTGKILDLIVFDARIEAAGVDLFEFIRTDEVTKQIPIIVLAASPEQKAKAAKLGLGKVEFLEQSCSPGILASKIATELRIRKMRGADANTASLAEINAALRDLNGKMQKELEEARAIQESLLPESLPKNPHFDLAVSYDPLEEVGGDWYFMREEPSGALSVLIADVTGHGLAAAFIGSMTKLALSATNADNPAKLLTGMNALMAPQLPPGRFVTMGCASMNPTTGEVQATCAGHPPCLLISPSKKEVRKIGKKGFALGFFAESEYDVETVKAEPGDVLVLVTDGITEASNRSNAMYGTDRIAEVIMQHGTAPAREMVKAVLDDMHKFCDGRVLKDDVTMIAVVLKDLS